MSKEKKQKLNKFNWKEHKKWISSFADVKIVYSEIKQIKRKRGKK